MNQPRPRRRKRWLVGGVLLLGVICMAGVYYYLGVSSDQKLQEALAEADRSDPGWRILELEAKRRKIPDEQNSGINLMNARANLPTTASHRGQTPEEFHELEQSAREFEAPVLLDERQVSALRKELRWAAKSLAEVYKIADKPRGRYPIAYTKDFIGTLLPNTQGTRDMARLLEYDAMVRAHDQDMDGAILACRCLIHAQRAVGDEPTAISTLVRIAIHQIAVKKLERILAQGQPSELALAGLQKLLEEELDEPLFLIAARGERGGFDGLMEALQTGEVKLQWRQLLGMAGPSPGSSSREVIQDIRFKFFPGSLKSDRAVLLHINNQLVELAKLPVEQQRSKLKELQLDPKDLPTVARLLFVNWEKLISAYHRDQARLLCGILLLAAERYRRAHNRWPERLDDLVPTYLAKVPMDPFDALPMRLGRFEGGIVIYSVSHDGQDNGGNLAEDPGKPGTDLGYRLWDVSKRRQPSKPREQADGK